MNLILAQIPPELWPRLIELGLAAPLIWWITTHLSTKVDTLTTKIDDNTWSNVVMAKTQLITLIALGQLDNPVKKQAEGVLQEIIKKEANRSPAERSKQER